VTKVRVQLEFSTAEMLALAGFAYLYGFKRDEPRSRWSDDELKGAARYAIEGLVRDALERKVT